jgi:hypothetical protein
MFLMFPACSIALSAQQPECKQSNQLRPLLHIPQPNPSSAPALSRLIYQRPLCFASYHCAIGLSSRVLLRCAPNIRVFQSSTSTKSPNLSVLLSPNRSSYSQQKSTRPTRQSSAICIDAASKLKRQTIDSGNLHIRTP